MTEGFCGELRLAGKVDAYAYDARGMSADFKIGDEFVIAAIDKRFPHKWGNTQNVRVYLGVEPVKEGPLWAEAGFCGTDVTPPDLPEIRVGDYDLLADLKKLDGREVLLIVEAA